MIPYKRIKHFNSIKVRLEFRVTLNSERLELFQFHKGAIGVYPIDSNLIICIKFQFHKGAIGVA